MIFGAQGRSQRRLGDQGVFVGPIMSVAGEQTDPLAIAVDDKPIA